MIPTSITKAKPTLHLLFVDDDPLYRYLMETAGAEHGIAVTSCGSWKELEAMAMPGVFDIAVVDYYLDGVRRELTGPRVAQRLKDTPTLFISANPNCILEGEGWPSSVRHFMCKDVGAEAILKTALAISGNTGT